MDCGHILLADLYTTGNLLSGTLRKRIDGTSRIKSKTYHNAIRVGDHYFHPFWQLYALQVRIHRESSKPEE